MFALREVEREIRLYRELALFSPLLPSPFSSFYLAKTFLPSSPQINISSFLPFLYLAAVAVPPRMIGGLLLTSRLSPSSYPCLAAQRPSLPSFPPTVPPPPSLSPLRSASHAVTHRASAPTGSSGVGEACIGWCAVIPRL